MELGRMVSGRNLAVGAAVVAVAGLVAWGAGVFTGAATAAGYEPPSNPNPASGGAAAAPILELNEKQLGLIKIGPVGAHVFSIQKQAVGSIGFDEDMSVQVFPSYQGKIISAFAQIGDEVQKGRPLYTIDSPDLVQAESTLIAAAATYDQNNRALIRARKLYDTQGTGGIAEKDLDAAVQAKLSAEGALKAARDAVRVFGKTEPEIDKIVALSHIDPVLVVNSPIAGIVTGRDAQPGLLAQPGNAPAPYAVADISTMWMLAHVPESDAGSIKLGQDVSVSVMAYPGHAYRGKVTTIGATVDPNLHTLLVRSEIQDPGHELRPGMLANFVILTGDPMTGTAVPLDGVVREGDGTETVWVTTDRHHFAQRPVKLGLQRDGYDQIVDGLRQGELVVTEGAVFLDNMLTPETSD
jgi:cobalt-zinc-cadmium efflux system membrane fusion protein